MRMTKTNREAPCSKCNSVEKTSRGRCASCARTARRKWYHRNREYANEVHRKWYQENKGRAQALARAWGDAHPNERAEVMKKSSLKKYGLTTLQYHHLHEIQKGLCGICGKSLESGVHVDHDHKTRYVRGLLCPKCNIGLGHFEDNPDLLTKAAAYLRSSPTSFQTPLISSEYKEDDGRRKLSPQIVAEVKSLREQNHSLGQIAEATGLSKSGVRLALSRER